MAEINLVPEIAQEEIKKGVYRRKSNIAAIVSLVVIGVIIGSLFAAQLALFVWGNKVESDTKTAEDIILSEKEKYITRNSLVDKLKKAESFLAARVPYSAGFTELAAVLKDTNVVLKQADFGEDDLVTVSGEAANSTDLDKLISVLVSDKTKKTFGAVQLVSLTGTKENPYTFTVDFRFPPKPGWVPKEEEEGDNK